MHISNAKINFQASAMATHQANGEEKANNRGKAQPTSSNSATNVTISHAGKMLSWFSGYQIPSLVEQATAFKTDFEPRIKEAENSEHTNPNSSFWIDMIYAKVDEEATKAYNDKNFTVGYIAFTEDAATRAQNREEARALAEYMAANNFDDPNEAKAFMDRINEMISDSEKQEMKANTDVRLDMIKKFAYEELGYTDETYFLDKLLQGRHGEYTAAERMQANEQLPIIINAMMERLHEDAEKGITKERTYEEWEEFGKYTQSEEGKAEAEEAFKAGNAARFAELKNVFYLYAQQYFDLTAANRQNLSVMQSLIDDAKEQVKATPIEDLLAKYNINQKIA